jgi:hypothetical protein
MPVVLAIVSPTLVDDTGIPKNLPIIMLAIIDTFIVRMGMYPIHPTASQCDHESTGR